MNPITYNDIIKLVNLFFEEGLFWGVGLLTVIVIGLIKIASFIYDFINWLVRKLRKNCLSAVLH